MCCLWPIVPHAAPPRHALAQLRGFENNEADPFFDVLIVRPPLSRSPFPAGTIGALEADGTGILLSKALNGEAAGAVKLHGIIVGFGTDLGQGKYPERLLD